MEKFKSYFGEFLGTFILTLVGCSTVAFAVLFGVFPNIIPIAVIWGIGVIVAIYATKNYSNAHLNPAVSAGFFVLGEISWKELFLNFLSQLLGAILAGIFLYLIFNGEIKLYEANLSNSKQALLNTASIFGEFFPNPGYLAELPSLSHKMAAYYEGIGSLFLMGSILFITNNKWLKRYAPIWIGIAVAILIMILAPYTQCGINPARDFGPRLVAYFTHWGEVAFPKPAFSFLTVYIIAPIAGAVLISFFVGFIKKRI